MVISMDSPALTQFFSSFVFRSFFGFIVVVVFVNESIEYCWLSHHPFMHINNLFVFLSLDWSNYYIFEICLSFAFSIFKRISVSDHFLSRVFFSSSSFSRLESHNCKDLAIGYYVLDMRYWAPEDYYYLLVYDKWGKIKIEPNKKEEKHFSFRLRSVGLSRWVWLSHVQIKPKWIKRIQKSNN